MQSFDEISAVSTMFSTAWPDLFQGELRSLSFFFNFFKAKLMKQNLIKIDETL